MWIMIAWVEIDRAHDGQPYARDLGYLPKLIDKPRAVACVWLRNGDASDVAKAQAFALKEGRHVFTYPRTEQDPIARAKRDALKIA